VPSTIHIDGVGGCEFLEPDKAQARQFLDYCTRIILPVR
jgi:hypothetical protein